LIALVTLALFVGVIYGGFRWQFPYGHRTCFLPCMLSALRIYAHEHEHAFPDGTNAHVALQKLYPQFMTAADNLAGVTGNIAVTRVVLSTNGNLTSNESSWVYIPGLKDTDDGDLMILYERTSGVGSNGRRMPGGRVVGFINGSMRMIPDAEWERFLAEQAKLRVKVKTFR
jgi:hypothetical protein